MKRLLGTLSVAALLATGGVAIAQNTGTTQPSGTPPATSQSSTSYPGTVGPTGSKQPDATNPVRSNPSGGGGGTGGGSAGGSGSAGGAGNTR